MKYKIILNLEEDYRLEVINDNGFVKSKHDMKLEELSENIRDLAKYSTETEEEKNKLLGTLRDAQNLFDLKSVTFNLKGKQ